MDTVTAPARQGVTAGILEWAEARRAFPGERNSGDAVIVVKRADGCLIAAVDALGHGPEAAAVAAQAVVAVRRNAEEAVIPLVRAVHEALRGTRGAVLSLGVIRHLDDTLTWVGVGNVQARLIRAVERGPELPASEALLLRGGILGTHLPPLYAAIVPIAAGDRLIFASDGLAPAWTNAPPPPLSPAETAAHLMQQFALPHDDAVVAVARYLGHARATG